LRYFIIFYRLLSTFDLLARKDDFDSSWYQVNFYRCAADDIASYFDDHALAGVDQDAAGGGDLRKRIDSIPDRNRLTKGSRLNLTFF